MDPGGIVTWLAVAVVLAGALVAVARYLGADPRVAALYLVPASLLGTYLGSESFTHMSTKGPDVQGYYILTSLVFGVVVGLLGMMASMAQPATAEVTQ